jgi:Wnt-binding factor required for Wnt secretion
MFSVIILGYVLFYHQHLIKAEFNKVSLTDDQKLMKYLLYILFLFDEPFAVLTIFYPSFFFSTLNAFFTASFISFVMFYLMLFQLRAINYKTNTGTYITLWKIVLFGIIWLSIFIIYLGMLLHCKFEPLHTYAFMKSWLLAPMLTLSASVMFYIGTLIYFTSRICNKLCGIPRKYWLTLLLSLVFIVLVVICLCVHCFEPMKINGIG